MHYPLAKGRDFGKPFVVSEGERDISRHRVEVPFSEID
jgi:hypothetical protein